MPPFLEVLAAACFASSSRGRPRGRGSIHYDGTVGHEAAEKYIILNHLEKKLEPSLQLLPDYTAARRL